MLLEAYLLTFLTVYDTKMAIVIFTASIVTLYISLLAGFAAIRNLQTERFWPIITAMTVVGVSSVNFVCLLVSHTEQIVMLVGMPVNMVLGFIASFAFGKRRDVILYWIVAKLVLDIAAMQLDVGVCEVVNVYLKG